MLSRRGRGPESSIARSSASEAGFTLVEVLVIMLIMGILAGIAVPSFLNQRGRADDSSSKAAARAAAVAIEAYASENLGSYQGVTAAWLNSKDNAIPADTDVSGFANCNTGAPDNLPLCWVITLPANTSTGTIFRLTKRYDGQILSDCDVSPPTSDGMQHGKGGCPSDGKWN